MVMGGFIQEFIHVTEITVPLLLQGILVTLEISVLAILLASVVGSLIAYLAIAENKVCRGCKDIY